MKKRNGQLIRALLITTVITVGFSNESHAKKLFGSETEWLGTQSDFNGGCVKSVSYTHLDVYKRQLLLTTLTQRELECPAPLSRNRFKVEILIFVNKLLWG